MSEQRIALSRYHLNTEHFSTFLYPSQNVFFANFLQINTPATVGILGKYGSGKSFLLELIRDDLKESNEEVSQKVKKTRQHQSTFYPSCIKCCNRIWMCILFFALFALPVTMLVVPEKFVPLSITNVTVGGHVVLAPGVPDGATTVVTSSGILLLALLVLVMFVGICTHNFIFSCSENLDINCMMGFSKLPKPRHLQAGKKNVDCKYILVNFDAWEYVGCDILWAGIITKLSEEIEKEFGIVPCRIFRAQYENQETCKDKGQKPWCSPKSNNWFYHICNYPKTKCHIPTICCWIFLPFLLVGLFVTGIVLFFVSVDENKNTALKPTFLSIPLLCAFISIIKLIWALFRSQSKRILQELTGASSNFCAELGFMSKVKLEVKCISAFIKWAEFAKNLQYKVVISIDNLDRTSLSQTKAVLEAVHILLSDPESPFICLIAIDHRIAAQSVEGPDENNRSRQINGYQYLKKIITLPIFYPEISARTAFTYLNELLAKAYHQPSKVDDLDKKHWEDDHKQSDDLPRNKSTHSLSHQKRIRQLCLIIVGK